MPEVNRCPLLLLSLSAVLALMAAGCGDKGPENPETAKVSGTVKYKGDPVEGASVTFMPAESKDLRNQGKGNAAYGMTDKDGKFTLRTFSPDDGALPGSYVVTVTKFETKPASAVPDVDSPDYNPDEKATPEKPPKNELPAKYESIKSSDLNAEVKSGSDNVVDLELKD